MKRIMHLIFLTLICLNSAHSFSLKDIHKTKVEAAQECTDNIKAIGREDLVSIDYMAECMDKEFSKNISGFGFSPIKDLPAGKNVVRLCSSILTGYEIIELSWTDSSRLLVFLEGNMDNLDRESNDGKIKKRTELKVKNKDVKRILDLIYQTDFYNQPSYRSTNGKDRETWYIEANIDGKYKSISREEPKETFLKDLGEALIRLAR